MGTSGVSRYHLWGITMGTSGVSRIWGGQFPTRGGTVYYLLLLSSHPRIQSPTPLAAMFTVCMLTEDHVLEGRG